MKLPLIYVYAQRQSIISKKNGVKLRKTHKSSHYRMIRSGVQILKTDLRELCLLCNIYIVYKCILFRKENITKLSHWSSPALYFH